MNVLEIILEPSVDCPKTARVVPLSVCEDCEHFYGYNEGETKVGCTYVREEVE